MFLEYQQFHLFSIITLFARYTGMFEIPNYNILLLFLYICMYDFVSKDHRKTHLILLFQKADIAVSPMHIRHEREEVVTFTRPYLDLGLTILLAKTKPSKHLFSILEPFKPDLWMAVVGSMFGVGILVTVCSSFSPLWISRYSTIQTYIRTGLGHSNLFTCLTCSGGRK